MLSYVYIFNFFEHLKNSMNNQEESRFVFYSGKYTYAYIDDKTDWF